VGTDKVSDTEKGPISPTAVGSPPLKADVSENGVRGSKVEELSSIAPGCKRGP